ncbi:hypothetical protein PhCBS80983_g04967 [Powellomyces hirtus]|uniref:Uncharacterized protein n=1 Tax=Powellomyces hirtus TaxID=109895 RepID=A0A507DVV9_9FUNG|nr:hypothetical protein PhCBS80983_g04967 [Powellomyces hirtus]
MLALHNAPSKRRLLLLLVLAFFLTVTLLLSTSQSGLSTKARRRAALASFFSKPSKEKTLVVYVYYDGTMTAKDSALRESWGTRNGLNFADANKKNPGQTDNLNFFLRHGLMSNVDHLFVMNSPVPQDTKIPKLDNIFVWEKENACYDLGSFHQGVQHMAEKHSKTYNRYILINASVRGPFMPTYNEGCWADAFLSPLSWSVKMVGTTVFCKEEDFPRHLQTMALAFDQQGYEAAIPALQCPATIADAIRNGEVPLTGLIEKQGFKTHSLMASAQADPTECGEGDMNYQGKYYGMNFHPYELVFMKTNRGIDDNAVKRYTDWHDKILARDGSSCPYHIPLR